MEAQRNTVILSVELDQDIYRCIKDFLRVNQDWDQQSLINAGMTLFLLQHHHQIQPVDQQACSQQYLKLMCDSKERHNQN